MIGSGSFKRPTHPTKWHRRFPVTGGRSHVVPAAVFRRSAGGGSVGDGSAPHSAANADTVQAEAVAAPHFSAWRRQQRSRRRLRHPHVLVRCDALHALTHCLPLTLIVGAVSSGRGLWTCPISVHSCKLQTLRFWSFFSFLQARGRLSVCHSVILSFCYSVILSFCLSVFPSFCHSVFLSVCVCAPVSVRLCLSVCVCVCVCPMFPPLLLRLTAPGPVCAG